MFIYVKINKYYYFFFALFNFTYRKKEKFFLAFIEMNAFCYHGYENIYFLCYYWKNWDQNTDSWKAVLRI